jgi:hypothetical protein
LYQDNRDDGYTSGQHFGCTWRGLCITSSYGNSNGIPVSNIVSINTGSHCEILTRYPHGLPPSSTVLIAGVVGVSGLNGLANATVTGATSLLLSGRSCTGTYQSGSGNLVRNVPTAVTSPNRGEMIVFRPGHEVRRVALHRSKPYDNYFNLMSYFASPRASLSRDGRYIAFASNAGMPELPSVWIVDTGISESVRIVPTSVTPSPNAVTFKYNVPELQFAALVIVSRSPDLKSNLAARVYDGQSSSQRTLSVPNLQPGVKYYYRISTGQYSYTGTFTTTSSVVRIKT